MKVMRQTAQRLGPQINVRQKPNGGHGNTILTGYREATADGFDWIFQIDSDDEMGPEKFGELWAKRNDHDFLVGIREGRRQTLSRRIISFASRLCVKMFYGKSVWDVNVPYRLMRVSAFGGLYSRIPLTSFAPNVILSGLAAQSRMRCFETRVPQRDRTTGEVSIKNWRLFKAAAKSFWQTVSFSLDSSRGWCVFACVSAISMICKFCASMKGWNFDFESYMIVSDIVSSGKNVYAETYRYNYGPIWFLTLDFIRTLFGSHFREGIILLLSLADIGIAAMLWRRKLFAPTLIFTMSNISIHISGFHNQFDNLAILAAFAALALLDGSSKTEHEKHAGYWCGVALLGISITIKHIFVFMPFWFLFRQMAWKRRILCCAIPLMIFLGSFAPYSGILDMDLHKKVVHAISRTNLTCSELVQLPFHRKAAGQYYRENIEPLKHPLIGIAKNVFLYRSMPTDDFNRCFLPKMIVRVIPSTLLFAMLMVGLGFFSRKASCFTSGLIYTLGLFAFTPAMAMQYYAIPCAAAAVFWWPFGIAYHVVAGTLLFFQYGFTVLRPEVRIFAMLMMLGCLYKALRTEIIAICRTGIGYLTSRFRSKRSVQKHK